MGALPKALARRGHRVMVVVPRYGNYAEGWETGVRRRFRVFNTEQEVWCMPRNSLFEQVCSSLRGLSCSSAQCLPSCVQPTRRIRRDMSSPTAAACQPPGKRAQRQSSQSLSQHSKEPLYTALALHCGDHNTTAAGIQPQPLCTLLSTKRHAARLAGICSDDLTHREHLHPCQASAPWLCRWATSTASGTVWTTCLWTTARTRTLGETSMAAAGRM